MRQGKVRRIHERKPEKRVMKLSLFKSRETKEPRMSRADADFGFSLVDEDDLRNSEYERQLEDKLQSVDLTAAEYKKRLVETRKLVMPLLQGLTQNPEKKGLLWPGRAEKVKELIRKMDKVAGDAK